MRKIKLILLSACLLMSIHLRGQIVETDTIYYEYELIAEEVLSKGDTVYQAYLIIEKEAIASFSRFVVMNQLQEKIITIKEKDFANEAYVTDQGDSYRIAIDQWSDIAGWLVLGEKPDKSKEYLIKKEQKDLSKHKVIDAPLPIDYSLRKNKDTDPKEQ